MIEDSEFLSRRERVKSRLTELGANQLVVTNSESIYYLCGATFDPLERPFFLIVPRTGPERLVVPFLEKDHLKKARALDDKNIHTYLSGPG